MEVVILSETETATEETTTATVEKRVRQMYLPVVRCMLVKESRLPIDTRPIIRGPQDIANICYPLFEGADREMLAVFLVNSKNVVTGVNIASVGILDSSLFHPREVFKPAILAGSAAVILAHNHPSGDPTPSPEDRRITQRVHEAGQIVGIDLLDHIVIGDNRFVSLKQIGAF